MAVSLDVLLSKLNNSPNNLDLINDVAMAYYQNPEWVNDDEDLRLFERAYNTKKTVKTTNNLAWQLYFEYGNVDRSLEILNECIALAPSSHFPYSAMGYILLEQKCYDEALSFLKEAESRSSERSIVNNIGVAHYHLGNFEDALGYFARGSELNDTENISLYNRAVTSLQVDNVSETEDLLDSLTRNIQNEFLDSICSYEVASIHAEMNNFELASQMIIELGIDGINLFDWPDLGYSLFTTHPELFDETVSKLIKERHEWISELDCGHEDWEEYSPSEKLERKEELRKEINLRKNLKSSFLIGKPKTKLSLFSEYCGCLLFGCEMHNNPIDDLS